VLKAAASAAARGEVVDGAAALSTVAAGVSKPVPDGGDDAGCKMMKVGLTIMVEDKQHFIGPLTAPQKHC
jgi:hypothetical protein